jgi:hypothetical protein
MLRQSAGRTIMVGHRWRVSESIDHPAHDATKGAADEAAMAVLLGASSIDRSARIQSQSTAPTKAKSEAVASAAGQPRVRAVSGTISAPMPPTTLPPVFSTPQAAGECRPPTEMAAAQ